MSMGQGAIQPRRMRPRPPMPQGSPPPGAPGGPQPAVPAQTPGGPPQGSPTPVGDIRSGAMDMYRNAMLRRMQNPAPGGQPPSMEQMMPGVGSPPPALGSGPGGEAPQQGLPPGLPQQSQQQGGDINDIIKQLMATRISRRVLGRGSGD